MRSRVLGEGELLARPGIAKLRAALRVFPATTGVVFLLAPRLFLTLCDDALVSLIPLFIAMERLCALPMLAQLSTLVAIPKPSGGVRLLALLPTFYRVWCRLSSDEARAWELRSDRFYFACKGGSSAVGHVHELAFFRRGGQRVGVGTPLPSPRCWPNSTKT